MRWNIESKNVRGELFNYQVVKLLRLSIYEYPLVEDGALTAIYNHILTQPEGGGESLSPSNIEAYLTKCIQLKRTAICIKLKIVFLFSHVRIKSVLVPTSKTAACLAQFCLKYELLTALKLPLVTHLGKVRWR